MIKASFVVQMDPLPDHGVTDLDAYANSLCSYVARNLEKFADQRGADVFVTLAVQRDEDFAGCEFRSGHYLDDGHARG